MHGPVHDVARPSPVSRAARVLLLILVLALSLWHLVEGWRISSWIRDEVLVATQAPAVDDAAIIGLESDQITLRRSESADADVSAPGVLGFRTDGGYLRLGEIVWHGGRDVIRTFETVDGTGPVIGAFGDLDPIATPRSVLEDAGLHETTYPGPLGEMDALALDGGATWVIHVHDRTRGPDQALTPMAVLADTGASQRSITYRNDPGQPGTPSGRFTFGVEERADLAAAVADARASGAEHVILVGYGTGAAVVMSQLYRDLDIAGAVLDGPVLDAESTVAGIAADRYEGLLGFTPATATTLGTFLAGLRFDVDWQTADYLSRAEQLAVPVLIIHGLSDEIHPVEHSRALATMHPGGVRLVEIDDAPAGLTWNLDPEAYEAAMLEFLDAVGTP